MRTIKKIPVIARVFLATLISVFGGCKDNVELPYQPIESYNKVYMPQAVNGPVNRVLKISSVPQTLIYGANFGGQGYPEQDIDVRFNVSKATADAFNAANKTNYQLLPQDAYVLSATTSVIPKGQLSTQPLTVSLKTDGVGAMDPLKTYILPISIANTTTIVNEALRTTYFIITAQPDFNDYPIYDRANWKVVGFSSQEAVGEGPNNGRAVFTLDGVTTTFWHTQWSGGAAVPPHFLIFDMGEVKLLHGVSILGRQADGSGKPNEVRIETSMDNVTWMDAGTFNLQNNQSDQKRFLPNGFKNARYFKILVNSAYNGTFTQIAEVKAF
jgi:hypothetical protein